MGYIWWRHLKAWKSHGIFILCQKNWDIKSGNFSEDVKVNRAKTVSSGFVQVIEARNFMEFDR